MTDLLEEKKRICTLHEDLLDAFGTYDVKTVECIMIQAKEENLDYKLMTLSTRRHVWTPLKYFLNDITVEERATTEIYKIIDILVNYGSDPFLKYPESHYSNECRILSAFDLAENLEVRNYVMKHYKNSD